MQTGRPKAGQARRSMRQASPGHSLQGLCITGGASKCKLQIGNLKLKIYNLQFSILIFAIFFLLIAAESFAGDIAFSISHPDKKVSPSAMAVYGEKIYVSYIREEGDVYLTVLSAEGKTIMTPVRINDSATPANGIHCGSKGRRYRCCMA